MNGSGIFLFEDIFVFGFDRESRIDFQCGEEIESKWYDVAKVLKGNKEGSAKLKVVIATTFGLTKHGERHGLTKYVFEKYVLLFKNMCENMYG